MVAPKREGVAGAGFSVGFSPKRALEGDCPVAGVVVLNRFPPPKTGGGVAAVPFAKIDGLEAVLLFASGEVCIESSPLLKD